MSARWDPTSNKDQHFFHTFSFWWRWAWFKDRKKQNSFQILVHIRICNFFFFLFFCLSVLTFFCFVFFLFLFSPCPSCISLRVCADREGRFHQHVYPSVSVRPSVHPCVWTCCVGCLLPVPVPCFLSVGGRGRSRKREQYAGQGRQGQSFGYVHIHGRSMASNKRQHYFRRSNTHTWNRAEVHLLDWIDHKKSLKKQSCVDLQIRLMRWLPLYPPLRSSKPQRFPLSLCNCGLKLPSADTVQTSVTLI